MVAEVVMLVDGDVVALLDVVCVVVGVDVGVDVADVDDVSVVVTVVVGVLLLQSTKAPEL